MRLPYYVLGVVGVVGLGGCTEQHTSLANGTTVTFRVLSVAAELAYSPQPERYAVLHDSAAWTAWRNEVHAQGESGKVDWAREGVVAIVAPEFPDGPASLEVTRASIHRDSLIVSYRLRFAELRNDFGSQEVGAVAVPKEAIDGHIVHVQRLASLGGEPRLVRQLPNDR